MTKDMRTPKREGMKEEIMTLKDKQEEWVPTPAFQMKKEMVTCKQNAKPFFARIKPAPTSQQFSSSNSLVPRI